MHETVQVHSRESYSYTSFLAADDFPFNFDSQETFGSDEVSLEYASYSHLERML